MDPIYKRLHHYVLRNDICQKTVALDAGMTQSKLSQLLNGRRRLFLEDYMRICTALGQDPRFFLRPGPWPGSLD